ncbi:MAG: hypothetical protein AB9873_08245 [Syntrophobacteraceae bacterium]
MEGRRHNIRGRWERVFRESREKKGSQEKEGGNLTPFGRMRW